MIDSPTLLGTIIMQFCSRAICIDLHEDPRNARRVKRHLHVDPRPRPHMRIPRPAAWKKGMLAAHRPAHGAGALQLTPQLAKLHSSAHGQACCARITRHAQSSIVRPSAFTR